MTLAALIHKSASVKVATATSATSATLDAGRVGTVAVVASVAVAHSASEVFEGDSAGEDRHFRWLIEAPARAPFEARCSPARTAAEMLALYPGATCEPLPDVEVGGADPGEPSLAPDDRRSCADCRNLDRAPGRDGFRRCRAAARGELPDCPSRRYCPAPDIPRRCTGFAPLAGGST